MTKLEREPNQEIRRLSKANRELAKANEALTSEVAALRTEERDAQSLLDGMPVGAVTVSANGEIETVNKHILDYLGQPPEVLKSWMTTGALVHPDDFQGAAAEVRRGLATGEPHEVEVRVLLRSDGVYRWFNVRAHPVHGADGSIARWYVVYIDTDDRKRAETALAASERNLQQTIDALPALAWSALADGKAHFLNQHFLDFAGRPLHKLRGWGWLDAIHPDDVEKIREVWTAAQAKGEAAEAEARMQRHDGQYRWLLFRTAPMRDENGNIVKWYGVNTDIEDRKRAELAVAESERNLRETINAIPTLAWCNSNDGSNEFLNQRWHDYTGLSPAQANGWGWQAAIHPDDLPMLLEIWRDMLASGQPGVLEARLRRHDGVYRWFLFRCDPLRDAAGAVVKWYGTNSDIDDLKRAEEALRSNERKLNLILNTIPTSIYVLGTDGSVLYANQTVTEYTGLTADDVRRDDFRARIFHPEDLERVREVRLASLRRPIPFELEMRTRRHDGSYRWFLNRYSPLLDEDGHLDCWYAATFDIDDLKRAEEAVRSNEHNLNLTLNTIPALIHALGTDGSVLYVNRSVLDYTGLTLDGVRKDDYRAHLSHPEDLVRVLDERRAALTQPVPFEVEMRVLSGDGAYRWFLNRYSPLLDAQGNLDRWYVVSFDIEDRKRAEEALRANEHNLNLILNTIPATIHILATDGTVLYVNQASLDYFGLTQDDVGKGNYRSRIFHPDDLARTEEKRVAALQRPIPFELEMRVRGASGDYRWFLLRYSPLLDEHGGLDRWYAVSLDIDDLKRTEEELKQTNDFFEEAQRLGRTGSFITDMDGDEHVWSDEARRIWGFERSDKLRVADIRARIHPDDLEGFDASAAQSIRRAQSVTHDFRVVVDGATRHLRLAAHAQKRNGHRSFAGALQDVTDQKLAEAALDRARSELTHAARALSLGVLTASIAHEVNQPLSGIVTNANTCLRMLDCDPPNVDGARDTARRTIRDGKRASEVISRLRTLFTKKASAVEDVDLNAAAREVIALSAHELQRHAIALTTSFDPELPHISGDRVQIQQVIINLLLNASDAVCAVEKGKRTICIETSRDGADGVRLSVRDNGMGLPEGGDAQLFDPFFTTKPEGMGIGLSVSRSIIDRHQGRLWAANNTGAGATFSFSIPRLERQAPPDANTTRTKKTQ